MDFSTTFKRNSAKELFVKLFFQIYQTHDFSSFPKGRDYIPVRDYFSKVESLEKYMFDEKNIVLLRKYVERRKAIVKGNPFNDNDNFNDEFMNPIEKLLAEIFPLFAEIDDTTQETQIFITHWRKTIKAMDKLSIAPYDKKNNAFALFSFRISPELKDAHPGITKEDLDALVKKTWFERLETHQKTYIPMANFHTKMGEILRIFHPDMNVADLSHLISQGWDRLSEQEKAKYA